jgi:hypothetical protein
MTNEDELTIEQAEAGRQRAMTRSALAVEAAMTEEDKARFLGLTAPPGSGLNGAAVADVLDIYADHDECLEWTEPFYDSVAYADVCASIGHVPEVRVVPTPEQWYMHSMTVSHAVLARAVLEQGVPDMENVLALVVAATDADL